MFTQKHTSQNREIHSFTRAVVFIIFLLNFSGISAQDNGSITDFDSHPPPSSGTYAYSPPGNFMPGNEGFPDEGESYIDPVFGATITRVSSSYDSSYRAVGYSGILVINADHSKCLLETEGGHWQIYALDGSGVIQNNPGGLNPRTTNWQWHPTDPDKLLFMTSNDLWEYSVSENSSTEIKAFGSNLHNGGEGNFTDRTGRYYAGWVDGTVRFYDRTEDIFYSNEPNVGPLSGGSVRMGPDGSGFISTGNSAKTWWYPVNHATNSIGSPIELCNSAPHADVMTDSSGVTWYIVSGSPVISVGGKSIENKNDMLAIPVLDPDNWHSSVELDWGPDVNVSGNIIGKYSNWYCMYTMGQDNWNDNTPWNQWSSFREEIFLVNVKTNEVRRIAHHRSRRSGVYQFQPKATVSTDGSYVIFHSNYGRASNNYVDAYVVKTPFADDPTSLDLYGTDLKIQDYKLYQNYPNPFNPETTIKYSLPVNSIQYTVNSIQYTVDSRQHRESGIRNSEFGIQKTEDRTQNQSYNQQIIQSSSGGLSTVKLVIYNILGNEVATLVNEQQRPGNYEVTWDASSYSSGVYFYQLKAGNFVQVKKLILMK